MTIFCISSCNCDSHLSRTVTQNVAGADITMRVVSVHSTSPRRIARLIDHTGNLIVNLPPTSNPVTGRARTALNAVFTTIGDGRAINLFRSCNNGSRPVSPLTGQFRSLRLTTTFIPLHIGSAPDRALCRLYRRVNASLNRTLTRTNGVGGLGSLSTSLRGTLNHVDDKLCVVATRGNRLSDTVLTS